MTGEYEGECHLGHILRKSGGIGPLTDGHRPYGITVSAIVPVVKIILGVMGFVKSQEAKFDNDDIVSAASLLAASSYLIIEGINQFVDETTNTFIEMDMKEDEDHGCKLILLGLFQLCYTFGAVYPLVWGMRVVVLDETGFDGADNFVFVLGLMIDAIINVYESIMIMCCKRCCVKTWCEMSDYCCCCDTTCGYCCFTGGGLTEISKRNICYGFITTTIVPLAKIFFPLIALTGISGENWSADDNATVASRAGFLASFGYVISDGINAFTDQFTEGAIENKASCSLTVAGIIQVIYTAGMMFFMNEALTAWNLSSDEYDIQAAFMLLIALGIDIFINLYFIT
eukprot:99842_1